MVQAGLAVATDAFSSAVLVVDLDGTLIKSDLLYESCWGALGRHWTTPFAAAKAGFTAFLSGLRNRLTGRGVQVVTVLPRFVATRITEGIDLPARLTADPEEVAEKIFHAVETGRDVIYVKSLWRLIMLIIWHIPERIFKRLDI